MEINGNQVDIQVAEFKKLLNEFKAFPQKLVYEPTYLELCSYPRSRFEEICSRLLRFFIDKDGPHGFGSLFIDSLIEIYRSKFNSNAVFGKANTLIAETEVKTINDNRIDLVITSDDFIICVENKIWAQRYNPFDDYFDYVESIKNGKNAFYVILSMGGDELPEGSKEQFKVVYYHEFIEKIKENIGEYLINCNRKYLSVLMDWFQHLENKGGLMSNFSDAERTFFQEKDAEISKLIARRSEFLNEKRMEHSNRIANIKKRLDPDESIGWWVYDKTDLGYTFENGDNAYEIGIESGFDLQDAFNVQITIWKPAKRPSILKNYRNEILNTFGPEDDQPSNLKWVKKIFCIRNSGDEQIVGELQTIFEKVNKMVKLVKEK